MPDTDLNSTLGVSGSVSANLALQQAELQSVSNSLVRENARLREQLEQAREEGSSSVNRAREGERSGTRSGEGSLDLASTVNLAVQVAELKGRTHEVLLAREFLYRICEARANGYLGQKPELYGELQARALELVKLIAIKPPAEAQTVASVREWFESQYRACRELYDDCAERDDAAKAKCAAKLDACTSNAAEAAAKSLPKPVASAEKKTSTAPTSAVPVAAAAFIICDKLKSEGLLSTTCTSATATGGADVELTFSMSDGGGSGSVLGFSDKATCTAKVVAGDQANCERLVLVRLPKNVRATDLAKVQAIVREK